MKEYKEESIQQLTVFLNKLDGSHNSNVTAQLKALEQNEASIHMRSRQQKY